MSLETGLEVHGLATMKHVSKRALEEIGSTKVHPYVMLEYKSFWARRSE